MQVFVPELLKQGQPSGDTAAPVHSIVEITASVAGVQFGGVGPYGTSKQASLGIAEALYNELKITPGGEAVHVSVLCPGVVQTGLLSTSTELTQQRSDLTAPIDGMKGDGSKASQKSGDFFKAMWSQGLTADYCGAYSYSRTRYNTLRDHYAVTKACLSWSLAHLIRF